MAIQLNERDHLIFKFIAEHKVLLEKHISWFIACDDKPVLIRDRLRKLFYLDYLLCERHRDTLPWWTTPTKPLVYMLSPMSGGLVGAGEESIDLNDCSLQRHLLEVANLRMIMLMSQKDEQISQLDWKTTDKVVDTSQMDLDATVSFLRGGVGYKVGIINHSQTAEEMAVTSLNDKIEATFGNDGVDMVFIISRDQVRQQMVQKALADKLAEKSMNKVLFATHQEVYKAGIVKSRWQNAAEKAISCFVEPLKESMSTGRMSQITSAQAMPA